jgi:7,8-dihydropterin-6-yl-methyl-4-(beta-D-ribofuranosyl)aminobenzene 5'-phosphate synthase
MGLLMKINFQTLTAAGCLTISAACAATPNTATDPDRQHTVKSLKVTILSTMLADTGIGEWGFSALIEADENRILFDAGNRPDTVLKNADELNVDLTDIAHVLLSHNHFDHTGGLLPLRRALSPKNEIALSTAHVGDAMFAQRKTGDGKPIENMINMKAPYEAAGGTFIKHRHPHQLFPGVWITGPIPRTHPERNWFGSGTVKIQDGWVEDNVPEELALVIHTDKGLVVITGCAHAGTVNTVEYAQKLFANAPVHALIGGMHLLAASDQTLDWTGRKLRAAKLQHLLGAHCTGLEAVYQLRRSAGLTRKTALVAAVGSSFTLHKGIDPLKLAR